MSVKSSVLAYLESQKSSYVSGEELAARLSWFPHRSLESHPVSAAGRVCHQSGY